MSGLLDGLLNHLRERMMLPLLSVRLVLCILLTSLPLVVGLPTQSRLVSVAYFLPLVFGVLGAMSLREHSQWLRPQNRLLWLCRGFTTVAADLACLLLSAVTAQGGPDRIGILSGALLAMTAAMVVACVEQDFAWLGASLVGLACLLASDRPFVTFLPTPAVVVFYLAAAAALAVRGPRSSD